MNKIIRSTTVPESLNTFCRGLLRELSEKYEVVALSSPSDIMKEIEEREGVRTIAIPMERHISLFKDFRSLIKIIRVIRKEKPTLIHSMTPKAGLLCMIAGRLNKVPIRIHTFTGLVFPTSRGLKRKILMLTDKITCACATHVIPEGEGVKNDLLNNGITKKSIKVLGYGNVRGVDMDFYSRRPEVMRIAETIRDNDKFTFLYVGRIVRDKGINELAAAFQKLHDKYPNTRLLLVGTFEESLDPVTEDTRHIIENHSDIMALGRKNGDELIAYYAAADCFVFPSYREGFPNTVMEAGALGIPSIVTDINGSREIIIEGENGIIIPSKDEKALYKAMERMMNDKEGLQQMASKARKLINDRFEQKYVRKCLYDYYDKCLQSLDN